MIDSINILSAIGIIGIIACLITLHFTLKVIAKRQEKESPNEIKKHGNYGYAIPEAAQRYKLDKTRMSKDVENNYRKTNLEPICFLCDKLELGKCTGMGYNVDLWHCNGMTISKATIKKYLK